MNYKEVHDSIINRCLKNPPSKEIYQEKHHIIPRCMGGTDDKINLVSLTYREHYLIHWLLTKIYPENIKLKMALAYMCCSHDLKIKPIASYMYVASKNVAKEIYLFQKGRPAWNKGLKSTTPKAKEINDKASKTLKEKYKYEEHHRKGKDPWNKGKLNSQEAWNKGIEMPKKKCCYCDKETDALNFKKWHSDNCKKNPDYKENENKKIEKALVTASKGTYVTPWGNFLNINQASNHEKATCSILYKRTSSKRS